MCCVQQSDVNKDQSDVNRAKNATTYKICKITFGSQSKALNSVKKIPNKSTCKKRIKYPLPKLL